MMGSYAMVKQGGYMRGGGDANILCILIMLVVLVDLILLGMWLWKRIKREDLKLSKCVCGCGKSEASHKE